jgi:hypothetical protein
LFICSFFVMRRARGLFVAASALLPSLVITPYGAKTFLRKP